MAMLTMRRSKATSKGYAEYAKIRRCCIAAEAQHLFLARVFPSPVFPFVRSDLR